MFFIIPLSELPEKFQTTNSIDRIYNLGIDYQTNSLDGIYENEEVRLFEFSSVGVKLDNRFTSYEISKGLAGIMINFIQKDRD